MFKNLDYFLLWFFAIALAGVLVITVGSRSYDSYRKEKAAKREQQQAELARQKIQQVQNKEENNKVIGQKIKQYQQEMLEKLKTGQTAIALDGTALSGAIKDPAPTEKLSGLALKPEAVPQVNNRGHEQGTAYDIERQVKEDLIAERTRNAIQAKWDQKADQEAEEENQAYVAEFIKNARARGYDVKMDENYNVELSRHPDSIGPQKPASQHPMCRR